MMNTKKSLRGWMLLAGTLGLAALTVFSSGCTSNDASAENGAESSNGWMASATQVPAGTAVDIRLSSTISSETAEVGSGWSGVVDGPVTVGDKVVFPSGSSVEGTVVGVVPAKRGDRAMLDLQVSKIDGKSVHASTEPVIAGSTRARNLGAIAGGAAAGALIGKAVGGDGKDAAIGGLIGGAAATGAVAASKGYQVVLKNGTVMTFHTDSQVAVR